MKLRFFYLIFILLIACKSRQQDVNIIGKWDLIDVRNSITASKELSFTVMAFELYKDNFEYIEFKNNKVVFMNKDQLPFQMVSYEIKNNILTIRNNNNTSESYQIKQEKPDEMILVGKGIYLRLQKRD
jgi:hypothetical protein